MATRTSTGATTLPFASRPATALSIRGNSASSRKEATPTRDARAVDASRQAMAFVQGRGREDLDRDVQLTLSAPRTRPEAVALPLPGEIRKAVAPRDLDEHRQLRRAIVPGVCPHQDGPTGVHRRMGAAILASRPQQRSRRSARWDAHRDEQRRSWHHLRDLAARSTPRLGSRRGLDVIGLGLVLGESVYDPSAAWGGGARARGGGERACRPRPPWS